MGGMAVGVGNEGVGGCKLGNDCWKGEGVGFLVVVFWCIEMGGDKGWIVWRCGLWICGKKCVG